MSPRHGADPDEAQPLPSTRPIPERDEVMLEFPTRGTPSALDRVLFMSHFLPPRIRFAHDDEAGRPGR